MNKWDHWYNSLPAHTKEYLKTQPVWHDSDLGKAFAMGIIIGVMIGLCM
jgi:hypothetical protein